MLLSIPSIIQPFLLSSNNVQSVWCAHTQTRAHTHTRLQFKALDVLKEWWDILTKVEVEKNLNDNAKAVWDSFYFPSQTYVWETMVRLAETEHKVVPDFVMQRFHHIFQQC